MTSWLFTGCQDPPPPVDLPPAKVAIIGAGMGGCFTAMFLRENGGEKLDIHVWAKKGSQVGGRSATREMDGHIYEAGASVMHSTNKYLSDAAENFGLKKKGEQDPTIPFGIYDGTSFLVRSGRFKIVTTCKMLWRYGFDLLRMNSFVGALLKKFENIYSIQAGRRSFASVEDMLTAMGGEDLCRLTQVSARDYMLKDLRWNRRLVDELITGALRVNYGQGTTLNTFTACVALAGMESGKLWSVVGGNWQLAEKALEASKASLVMDDVVCVKKHVGGNGKVNFSILSEDGRLTEGFDVVIVANPLNISSIKYENLASDVYTPAATTPYQRTVATLTHARINQEFFGVQAAERNFPQVILTSGMEGSPFHFNSVATQIPADVTQEEVGQFTKPLRENPKRVWKVFSPKPLTEAQLSAMFTDVDETDVNDWQAYPHYHPPEQFPSFVLDDGVYYINAIEKAASAMEMSVIGAKNVAMLAQEYILNCC